MKLLAIPVQPFTVVRSRHRVRAVTLVMLVSALTALETFRILFSPVDIVEQQSLAIQSRLPDLAQQTDDIYEALWRPVIANATPDTRVLFLRITTKDGESDPDDALMQRFAAYKTATVKKVSACYVVENEGGVVHDKVTGETGVIFSISKPIWKSRTEVYTTVSYYSGNLGSEGHGILVRKKKGRWKIVHRWPGTIS